jgi:hypothetical protein
MPYFSEDDMHISPDEFLEKCHSGELDETFRLLTENYNYDPPLDDINEKNIRSESHRIFLRNLEVLKQNWYSLGKEEVEIINILAKKAGGTI